MPDKAREIWLSPLAENDLEDIWLYTSKTWSRNQADRYHDTIMDAIWDVASGGRTGRDASDIREGYRKCAVGRHVLFYRESDVGIDIIRILHQSMDIPAHLGSEDHKR